MTIQVLYASKTGHTKQIAQTMAAALGVQAQDVQDKPEIKADLLFIGSGIYASRADRDLCLFVKKLTDDQVKHVVLFYTSMTGIAVTTELPGLLRQNGILVEDHEFSCKGKFLFFSWRHPNEKDLEQARGFALALRDRIADADPSCNTP